MSWAELRGRPLPAPTQKLAYGPLPQQFGELWLPPGKGRHPLVMMIHGGCWTKSIAGLDLMNYVAEDLRRRGVAVWNIEYRGVDEAGGGYPGTYQDVAAAIDFIRPFAKPYGFDLNRTILLGHSAGGHLALWAAARHKLPQSSPLYAPHPPKVMAVIDLAGLADLQADTDTACGPGPVAAMVGQPSAARPDVYADTSPAALVPLGVPQYVIHGAADSTVKPEIGFAYAQKARAAGDTVTVSYPPGGHTEEIAPGAPSWDATAALISRLVK